MTKREKLAEILLRETQGVEWKWVSETCPETLLKWITAIDAILAELEQPTPEMLDAGQDDAITAQMALKHTGHITVPVLKAGWQAMIRAIREEGI